MKELKTTLKDAQGGASFNEKFNDAYCRRLKARYIAQGLIKESTEVYRPGERPYMSAECVAKLRQKMIDNGTLIPKGARNAIQVRGAAEKIYSPREAGKTETRDSQSLGRRDSGSATQTGRKIGQNLPYVN